MHDVRDFTCNDDRRWTHVRHMSHDLACLTNAGITIVRCQGRFRYLPETGRHHVACPQDTLDAVLYPPDT